MVFACGPRSRNESAAQSTTPNRTKAPAAAVRAPAKAPLLASSFSVNVQKGVKFAFRVTNQGGKTDVSFPSGRTHDVVVLDSLGREVWRWSSGRLFTQMLQNKVLRTDAELAFEDVWAAPRSGKYVAVASLASMNYPIEQRTEFVVP